MLTVCPSTRITLKVSWSQNFRLAGPSGYGPMKRITVTHAPGASVATWASDIKAAEAKAAVELETAKQKAAQEAGAKAKAQVDAEAAVIKRKADYEAAVAANLKARDDAIAAKQKARALQLENAKTAKQGLLPLNGLAASV